MSTKICKYLSGGIIQYCKAFDRLMVPSILETVVFCKDDFLHCPIYKESEASEELRKKPMKMDQEGRRLDIQEGKYRTNQKNLRNIR